MFLLYCDETNFQKTPGDFFVYGGVAIPGAAARALADDIAAIRTAMKVPAAYELKFNPGPEGFSHQQFIDLKKTVIAAAVKHECKLLVNLCLHDIAKSSEEARRYGINTLAYHFDCFLNRPKVPGLMMIDRFSDKQLDAQLKEKINVGLTGALPFSATMKIEWIVGFHLAGIGQSHFCSLVDVVLGSLRFAINCFTQKKQEHQKSAGEILSQLAPLFFRESGQFIDPTDVTPISLWFSPKEIKADKYAAMYNALRDHLTQHGIKAAQKIERPNTFW